MKSTRRLFLQETGLLALATVLPTAVLAQSSDALNPTFSEENLAGLKNLSAATFEPWIGSRFSISLNGVSKGWLLLTAVDSPSAPKAADLLEKPADWNGPRATSGNTPEVTSFALRFERTGTPLVQETYLLEHDWLGKFPLLLVPSGLAGSKTTCTATFSLFGSQESKL